MGLRRLCKAEDSYGQNNCPAVYADGDPRWMVSQGKRLDEATEAELLELGVDEIASRIPTETLLRAAGLFLAERGRPSALVEIEAYLADTAR